MTAYLITPPASEPVTLDDAKAYLKLDNTDEDDFVGTLIAAARLHVESVTGLALIAQDWRLTRDEWPCDHIVVLPRAPFLVLTAITAYDVDGNPVTLDLAGVQPDTGASPARLFLPSFFAQMPVLRGHAGLEIDYRAGFGTDAGAVPADLKQAILVLVAFWFEHRDAVVVAGSGAVLPHGFDVLMAPYRQVRL